MRYPSSVLEEVTRELDQWIIEENTARRADGRLGLSRCEIRLLGQAALLEQRLPIPLTTTRDVDVRANYEHAVEVRFRELLARRGLELDPVGHEAWMPRETRYTPLFQGDYVRLLIADPEAILVSKGLKAPRKNRHVITTYLAGGPSERFLTLAARYGLDLEQFL